MTIAVGLIVAGALRTATPPAPPIDPTLPPSLRPVVATAVQAELDPRRGPGNALAILDAAVAEHAPGSRAYRALNQRKAAVALRRLFLTRDSLPEPSRYGLALSTFSLLELGDPGLDAWLSRAWTQRAPPPTGPLAITTVLLVSGDLDRRRIEGLWTQRFRAIGVSLQFGPAQAAAFVLRLRGEGIPPPKDRARAVRLRLGIERIIDGRTAWRTTVTTEAASDTAKGAVDAGVDWLTRVGGRNLLFRWLRDEGVVPRPGARLPDRGH